jgi:hypothetical protein
MAAAGARATASPDGANDGLRTDDHSGDPDSGTTTTSTIATRDSCGPIYNRGAQGAH